MKDTKLITVYGGRGSGKSNYARTIVEPSNTFILGTGTKIKDLLTLQFGGLQRHLKDNEKRGIENKTTSLKEVCDDIKTIKKPYLVIDEWTDFFYSCWWKPREDIVEKIEGIYCSIKKNDYLEKVVLSTIDTVPFYPLKLYKKLVIWNKEAFRLSDEVIKVEFGIPVQIKP